LSDSPYGTFDQGGNVYELNEMGQLLRGAIKGEQFQAAYLTSGCWK
jgi:hypothetical protein